MIAALATALEQFGEMFQALLSKQPPAAENVGAARRVVAMCHEPARKKVNGRKDRRNESPARHANILWKTFWLSSDLRCFDTKVVVTTDSWPYVRVHPMLKSKDPSGGTTGRVKPYGRLGWMGARA